MAAMQTDAFTVGFVVALALAFVGVVVVLIRRARRARAALHGEGAVAEGEIVRVLREPNGAYLVRYEFLPEGASEPLKRDEYIGYLVAEVPEVGTKVKVRYHPQAPEKSLLVRDRG